MIPSSLPSIASFNASAQSWLKINEYRNRNKIAYRRAGWGYNSFSWWAQLSMKFIMLKYVKMPTIVGILTFISMSNTPSKSLTARKLFILEHFSLYEQLKFMPNWAEKNFITSGPGCCTFFFAVVWMSVFWKLYILNLDYLVIFGYCLERILHECSCIIEFIKWVEEKR